MSTLSLTNNNNKNPERLRGLILNGSQKEFSLAQHQNLPWGPLGLGTGSEKESQSSAQHSGFLRNMSELKRKKK
jgi:hypothetical protein